MYVFSSFSRRIPKKIVNAVNLSHHVFAGIATGVYVGGLLNHLEILSLQCQLRENLNQLHSLFCCLLDCRCQNGGLFNHLKMIDLPLWRIFPDGNAWFVPFVRLEGRFVVSKTFTADRADISWHWIDIINSSNITLKPILSHDNNIFRQRPLSLIEVGALN